MIKVFQEPWFVDDELQRELHQTRNDPSLILVGSFSFEDKPSAACGGYACGHRGWLRLHSSRSTLDPREP